MSKLNADMVINRTRIKIFEIELMDRQQAREYWIPTIILATLLTPK